MSLCTVDGHRLNIARWQASTNFDQRPDVGDLSLIVIHNISLPPHKFGGGFVEKFFTNQLDVDSHPYFKTIHDVKVSSHLFIDRGGAITQFVEFDKRAWHAGQSSFKGRNACNDFSIGIELEGTDETPYTDAQYNILNIVCNSLKQHYPISDITGHSNIAPERKTDPGDAFDWRRIL